MYITFTLIYYRTNITFNAKYTHIFLNKNDPFAIHTCTQWWLQLSVSAANNYQTA
jgi:hypothetical protein